MTKTMNPLLVGALLGVMSFGFPGTASAAPVGALNASTPSNQTIQLAQMSEEELLLRRNRGGNRDGQQMRRRDRDNDGPRMSDRDRRDGPRLSDRERRGERWRNGERRYSWRDHGPVAQAGTITAGTTIAVTIMRPRGGRFR